MGEVWLPHTDRERLVTIDQGPRPRTAGVIIHVNDGYYDGTRSWFRSGSGGVGAHVEFGAEKVVQFVPLERKCWHAVDRNADTIGFEHEGWHYWREHDWTTHGHMLHLSANRLAWVCHEFGLGRPRHGHNVWGHGEGGAAWGGHPDCPGPSFPWGRYMRLATVAYLDHWGRR